MRITLPIKVLKSLKKDELEMLLKKNDDTYKLERMLRNQQGKDTDRVIFDLHRFSIEELTDLWSLANRNDVDSRTMNNIQRWTQAVKDPLNSEVPSVPAFRKMAIELMATNDYKWLMRTSDEGYNLPSLVTGIHYTPRSKYNAEHVTINLKNGVYYKSAEYSTEDKTETETESVSIYSSDLSPKEETVDADDEFDLNTMYDRDELDEEEEDDDDYDEDNPKPKKKVAKKKPVKKKRENLRLLEILANHNLFMPTEETLNTFFEHSKLAYRLADGMGKQYTCSTKAFIKEDKYSRSKAAFMHEEGRPFKLIIDMKGVPAGLERQVNTDFGMQFIPYHPYLRLYNLTKYSYCDVHAASLVPYKYDKDIINNMIADKELKDYLASIMGGADVFKDIVSGKSGGMIVLASGGPGLGKTLTAETYSELMEMPLYQIQSSQLGLNIGDIESKLSDCLRRSERWNAVLLIDECDTYVRKRGEDIEQNCIVGVFLKLLEYFNGVMFLTTNRHDIIDEAILSRCTAHIRFELPSPAQRAEILKVHCNLQGIKITDKDAKEIGEMEMSGRDIRNMLKNIKKFYHKEKVISLTRAKINPIEKYIPFLK